MSNFNKVMLMGRLTRDPELRYTTSGTAVTDLGLAINRFYTVQGERREETTFVDVTVWRNQAETVCKYMRKGRPIFIEGRLSLDTWEGQDGQKRSRLRVIADTFQFLGGPRDDGNGGGREFDGNYGGNYRQAAQESGADSGAGRAAPAYEPEAGGESFSPGISDEDIPF